MLNWALKLVLGVEISRENLRLSGIIASSVVIIFGYLLFVVSDFFGIIDNLLIISQQPWYSFYLAKFSFLMIFIKIIFLSLFTTKNNPAGRFIAAFVTQFLGLIGTVILYVLSDISKSIITDPQMKTIVAIIPYIISIGIFLIIRVIYEVEYFDEKKFFNLK